jgi:hypothetical protein
MNRNSATGMAPALQRCPKCGSSETVPIFYGLFDVKGLSKLKDRYGEHGYKLGGCSLGSEDTHCRDCGHNFEAQA